MDTYRLFVGVVFAISVFLLADAWVRDHATPPKTSPSSTVQSGAQQTPPPTPTVGGSTQSNPAAGQAAPKAAGPVAQTGSGALGTGERVEVRTDYLVADIDTLGGDLRRVELLQHRDRTDTSKNFVLLQSTGDQTYIAQSGLIGNGLPSHNTHYSVASTRYELAQGQDSVVVKLTPVDTSNVKVTKMFTFHRASYVIDVSFQLTNQTSTAIDPYAYFQLLRDSKPPAGDSKMVPTYSGAEVYTEKDKLQKVTFSDIEANKGNYPKTAGDGWVALVQHYFLTAWLPKPGVSREFFLKPVGNGLLSAGVIVPVGSVAPGQTAISEAQLYVGPQEQDQLKVLAPGLELTVDYGWLRVLAVPLFWVLNKIHEVVGNWGVAIIILTIIIKVIFYPLSAASYKSMARMKLLAPKLQRLKERFGDDRQKMHEAMIELYKTEKINPLGGCLPIVVQIPVFIALYWTLLLSVELRHAPFMLWIHDLSAPDPYYILPVLMGATMFIQSWLNPAPPDPMQAKLMKIMPVAFSVFFFFFPAGLVLYWLVNNILSIAQQWQITRSLERSKPAHGAS
jgi:YidC/Oxa1 family membrane protein insertase